MPYLNRATLIGNIGRDAEIKTTSSGRKFVQFSIATTKKYKDQNGDTKDRTNWHNVKGWGKIADIAEQLQVKKGTTLYVEGSIEYEEYTDSNNNKRWRTEILMDTMQVLTPRNGTASSSNEESGTFYQAKQQSQQHQGQNAPKPQNNLWDSTQADDDLPF